jgi:hypothetical protein
MKIVEASNSIAGQLLAEVRSLRATHSEYMAKLYGQIVNDVLGWGVSVLDADGFYTNNYRTVVGSLTITNYDTTPITVASGSGSASAQPTQGVGVMIIPASSTLSFPLGSTGFSVWGTATKTFGYQAFTGMQALSGRK